MSSCSWPDHSQSRQGVANASSVAERLVQFEAALQPGHAGLEIALKHCQSACRHHCSGMDAGADTAMFTQGKMRQKSFEARARFGDVAMAPQNHSRSEASRRQASPYPWA